MPDHIHSVSLINSDSLIYSALNYIDLSNSVSLWSNKGTTRLRGSESFCILVIMFVHGDTDNEFVNDFVDDPVALISRMDMSNPLKLHPNDSTALTIVSTKLKGLKITKLHALWKQFDFLMGFDDSYMQISSSILSREVLPDVKSAYATISSEESHRVASSSIVGSSQRNQASAFVSNVPNRNNFQRIQNFNNGPKPNNVNNNRQNRGYGLVCEHCGFKGHTIDKCFKLIGYPADFGKKKYGQNFKNKNVSNNNVVGYSSSSGFTDEQMATLISLIKDNSLN
ncbi:hypothetical protein Tco_0468930 [Tanacetum coccineum]